MERDAVRELFDRQLRQGARPDGPGTRVERVDGVVRQTGTADDWNGVLWSDLDEVTADAAIAAQVRYFTARGCAFEWKLYAHDGPGDLGGRLTAAGFAAEPEETVMVAPVRDLPTAVDLPEDLRLLQVTDAAGVDLMVDVHARAFGADSGHLDRKSVV